VREVENREGSGGYYCVLSAHQPLGNRLLITLHHPSSPFWDTKGSFKLDYIAENTYIYYIQIIIFLKSILIYINKDMIQIKQKALIQATDNKDKDKLKIKDR
jgi:hypothetical protein